MAFVENQTESEKNVAAETSRSARDRDLVFCMRVGCGVGGAGFKDIVIPDLIRDLSGERPPFM